MSSSQTELREYVRRVGENINMIYKRLGEIDERLDIINKEISNIRTAISEDQASMKALRENAVARTEFDEFVSGLTRSFSDVIQPIAGKPEEEDEEKNIG